ncbi:MAG: MATE family efflux transporter [Lachnospiraceae bacterium]|nr:MATE family efflux transporter [Lachnospiraceae bacterium]
MTQTPIPRLVTSLAAPTIVSMLITSFYNMADTFFVGKINTSATAAVGVVFSLMALIQAVGFFCGHGSGNYISRKLGEKQIEDASKMAATGFFLALFLGCAIMILGLVFLEPLAYLLGSTDTILPYAKEYLRIILLGAPYMTASLVLNNQMRFQGSAAYAMLGIVSGAVLNIGLDPLFIFVFDMGVSGAALATIISQLVGFLLLLIGIKKSGNLKIRWKNFSFNQYYLEQIFQGGIPSLCRQGLASVSAVVLNHAAGGFGDAAIAGMSIVSRVSMFANSALIGFGQGFQPVCGFNYGAKLYHRVREAFWFCVKYAAIFLVFVSAIGIVFAPQTIALFRKDDIEVIEIGTYAMRMVWFTFPLGAWIVLCNMLLQSCGKALSASILSSARQGLFFIPILLITSYAMGLRGIQMSQSIADICTFILAIPLTVRFLKEIKQE